MTLRPLQGPCNPMTPADNTLFSRHECKYYVAEEHVPAVRAMIRPFTRPDRFAARSPRNSYALSSLYLDNPDLALLVSTEEGHKNRFKLRVRAYDDDPASMVFLEIKRRVGDVVLKTRAPMDRRRAGELLRTQAGVDPDGLDPDAAEFLRLVREMGAGPVVHVRYEREAYEARGRAPVRVTFDRKLSRAITDEWEPRLQGDDYRRTPTAGVILEVKFTDSAPSWVDELISRAELMRTSIPKYALCIHAAEDRGEMQRGQRRTGRITRG
ncbi:MAG: SPX domain protein involved in polyphosphate accumulation [Planctomycetota bacterium]|jgi:SPX domain protein involved in polyphosphate accumulation